MDLGKHIFLVLFGRLTIRTKAKQILGGDKSQSSIGCTLGEEILFDCRYPDERAIAESQSCVLGISVDNYNALQKILQSKK